MNISQTISKSIHYGSGCCGAAILGLSAMAGVAHAATVPAVVSAPVGAGVQSVGGAVSAVGVFNDWLST